MVLQADGDPNNGRSDIGRDSPKKTKANKIPQRGLGIAALEKLRRDEQQKRISASFYTDDNLNPIASTFTTGEHLIPDVTFESLQPHLRTSASFVPVLEPTSRPCCFGSYAPLRPHSDPGSVSAPLSWNSIQQENSLDPNSPFPLFLRTPPEHLHKQKQKQQRSPLVLKPSNCPNSPFFLSGISASSYDCLQVIKSFLSPPSSSGACPQTEPPSNQSYGSTIFPSIPEDQKLATLKRSWPFPTDTIRPSMINSGQHASPSTFGNDQKRISLPRDDASSSSSPQPNIRAEGGGVSKLDGGLLSLSLLPASEPSTMPALSFQKHYVQVQRNTHEKVSEAVAPPTLHNFMGLPHDLIESNPNDAETDSKGERKYR